MNDPEEILPLIDRIREDLDQLEALVTGRPPSFEEDIEERSCSCPECSGWLCPRCGAENSVDWPSCPHCGTLSDPSGLDQ